ncbi:MAG: hypothetical protein E6J91_00375 [Deltaproteobacteria bacterium]|nr:MAG: hypothetical protein E6J91_00375 [Deltaproteobacteria bacterium]
MAAAIAVALGVIVIIDLAHAPESVDRALVPGFDPARATELIWERGGRPAIHAVRSGDRWELRDPGAVPADGGAIGDVLAALRGARWHRRGDAPPARATLVVVAGSERHVLSFGDAIAGTEQSWLVVDGRGVVVDTWIVRALDRDALSLRIRRPLAEVAGARTIRITGRMQGSLRGTAPARTGAPVPGVTPPGGFGPAPSGASGPAPSGASSAHVGAATGTGDGDLQVDLEIAGAPRRLVRPSAILLAPEAAAAVEHALREVTIVRLPDGPVAAGGLAIETAGASSSTGVRAELGGSCPGAPELVALSGTAGDGCVERAAVAAIERAVAWLQQPAEAIVERRPIPFEPQHLVLADAAALDTSPPRIGDAAADPARVAELLLALEAPAGVARLPAGPPTGHIVATDRSGTAITLDLFPDHVLARHGEPVALAPAPGAWRLLVRPSRELRDRTLWLEEPATIAALDLDGVGYRRGAVLGAWTRRPDGAVDAARVDALAAALAAPRALGFLDEPIAVAHRVTVEVAPPVGAAVRHVLELGAPRAGGCPARAGRDIVLLPAAICAEVAALAR